MKRVTKGYRNHSPAYMTEGNGELVWFASKEAHTSAFSVPSALASSFCFVPLSKSLFPCSSPLLSWHIAPLVPVRASSDGQWALRMGGWAGCLQAKLGRGVQGDGAPGSSEESLATGDDDLLLARIPSCRGTRAS